MIPISRTVNVKIGRDWAPPVAVEHVVVYPMDLRDNGRVPERLLSLPDVGLILRVSVRTVHRLISAGDLPVPVKVRRSSRMPADEVAAYVERLKGERDGR